MFPIIPMKCHMQMHNGQEYDVIVSVALYFITKAANGHPWPSISFNLIRYSIVISFRRTEMEIA